jgi:hypothetical protein
MEVLNRVFVKGEAKQRSKYTMYKKKRGRWMDIQEVEMS